MKQITSNRNLFLKFPSLALLFVLLLSPVPVQSGVIGQCLRPLTQLILPYAVEHHTGATLRPLGKDSGTITLTLGKRIGLGDRGGLYRIEPDSHLGGIPTGPSKLVAKVPHTVRFNRNPAPHPQAELEMKRELQTYDLLKSSWVKVEGDPKYPKEPAWEKGSLPTAPILKSFESRQGTILIKPEIQGRSLKQLYEQHRGKLPLEMERSIRDIYATIDAISSQVKTPIQDSEGKWAEGRPFYTDINPANLVWVEEPSQLKSLGLKRPTFIFYEMTPLIHRMPQYLPLSEITGN